MRTLMAMKKIASVIAVGDTAVMPGAKHRAEAALSGAAPDA